MEKKLLELMFAFYKGCNVYIFSLLFLTQKLSESHLKPWQQGVPQSVDQWTVFFAAVTPTLALVRYTLSLIIQTRGSEVSSCHTYLAMILYTHKISVQKSICHIYLELLCCKHTTLRFRCQSMCV